MAFFKNTNFTKRDWEFTNIVACVSERAPNFNWIPADESILSNLTQIHIATENGREVRYFGHL